MILKGHQDKGCWITVVSVGGKISRVSCKNSLRFQTLYSIDLRKQTTFVSSSADGLCSQVTRGHLSMYIRTSSETYLDKALSVIQRFS